MLLLDLVLLVTGHLKDEELVMTQESEDLAALNRPHGDAAKQN
jgi:hypothetical protein